MAERPIDSLDDLMDGGVRERFKTELDKVWNNVYDPNTDPEKTREIILRVKITPNQQRDSANFRVDVTSKLAPMESLQQTVLLSLTGSGQIIDFEDIGAEEVLDEVAKKLGFEEKYWKYTQEECL